ncbi:unnamed protein product [Effrenium voratum]|nr:unnamed protein product [Effrenium voratum]
MDGTWDPFALGKFPCSYPLVWTELHNQYKELFDQQFEAILWFQDSSPEQFHESCRSLLAACENLPEDAELDVSDCRGAGVTVAAFRSFLSALTASEDFERFLQVMFAACCGTLRPTLALPKDQPSARVVELAVPPGAKQPRGRSGFGGEALELRVPQGCEAQGRRGAAGQCGRRAG